MATSSVTSTTPAANTGAAVAAKVAAANASAASKTAAQKIMTSLGAGSGVDTNALAQSLVDAERAPQEAGINSKISKNEARVSGYSAISYVFSQVQTAFSALKDQTSFNSLSASSSNTAALAVTTGAYASEGSHDVEILQLAKNQRTVSNGVASATASLNAGKAMSIQLTIGGAAAPAISIAAGLDTPQDIADAINTAKTGVTAQVVNTGDGSANPFQVVLKGATGAAGAFTVAVNYGSGTGSPGLGFSSANPNNQAAADAKIKVDGVNYTRNTNAITDIVSGVTFNLKGTTTSPASVDLVRDTTAIKEKINTLVTSYNDAVSMMNVLTDPKSTVETYGATLVGDSTARSMRQQLRDMFVAPSSTPGTSVASLWQVGLSIDSAGSLTADATKLDAALTNNYADVVKTFTGNLNNVSAYTVAPAGIAGDAIKKMAKILGPTGTLATQTTGANTQNTKYQTDLSKLGVRMDSLLARYQKQFAAMSSLVGSVTSQKASLKATFDGMSAKSA
jgi:flagellar hook-associated protein 2